MPLTYDIGVRIPYPLPKKAIGNGRFFCSGPEATAGPAGREGWLAPGKPGQPRPPGGKTARRQVELRSEGGRGSRPNGRRGSDPSCGEAPTKKRDSPNGRSNGRDSAQRRKRLQNPRRGKAREKGPAAACTALRHSTARRAHRTASRRRRPPTVVFFVAGARHPTRRSARQAPARHRHPTRGPARQDRTRPGNTPPHTEHRSAPARKIGRAHV